MCSIAGFVASKPLSEKEMVELCDALLWYGQSRGRQSCGVWTNHKGGLLYKRATHARDFVSDAGYTRTTQSASMALLHTRQPTSGGTGDEQAQPFHKDRTITVHNGMVHNVERLRELFKVDTPSGVDSEIFTSVVARYGPKSILGLLRVATGSSAVGMMHKGKMYIIRDGNPLEAITLQRPDMTITIFASTKDILFAAIRSVWYLPLDTYAEMVPVRKLMRVRADGVEEIGEYDWQPPKYERKFDDDSSEYGYGFGYRGIGSRFPSTGEPSKPGRLRRYNFDTKEWEEDREDYGADWPDTDTPPHKRNESPTLPVASNGSVASNGNGSALPASNDDKGLQPASDDATAKE